MRDLFPMVRFFLLIFFLIAVKQTVTAKVDNDKPHRFIVVLDAGHGGKDTGALGSFSEEKEVVLNVTLKIGEIIQERLPNVKIIYTRTDDTFIPLYDRARIANENKADLFVSLHANSSRNITASGTETFVMGLHKTTSNLEVAQKENAVIALEDDYSERYEGYDPSSAESFIIFSLMTNAHLDQSLFIADIVQKEFTDRINRKNRGVKQAGFLVLWNTTMPSILVELGFISNINEERYLNSEKGTNELSESVFNAIKVYIDDLEKNLNALNESKNHEEKEKLGGDNVIPNKQDIYFSIQLTASKSTPDLKKKEFIELTDVYYIPTNGFNKYYHGSFAEYTQAKEKIEACKKYFPGAFIVAFEEGNPISVDVAIRKSSKKQ
ncbi:MAG: N-acetylmuramoyl-L-alanine amidase [Salinivirgaceae bacterium]|nr:N-acetylmuramoyl-L-alanine amidase [Salinivirgaceae bacterium]